MHDDIKIAGKKTNWVKNRQRRIISGVQAGDIRVASFDWVSYDGTTTIWDGDFTQGLSASIVLAAQHFNERRADIIPALGTLNCGHNITVVDFCDTAGNPSRAIDDLLHLLRDHSPIHFVTGPNGVDDLAAASMLAERYSEIPSIASSVTSPRLADRNLYGMNLRISPMDSDHADAISRLILQFGFKKVAFLHLSDGKEFAAYLGNQLLQQDVLLTAVEFQYGNGDEADAKSIQESVQALKALNLNVIMCATWAAQTGLIATKAKENGLMDPKNLWIFTYLERSFTEQDFTDYPALAELLPGSLHVSTEISQGSNPQWDAFLSKWTTFQPSIPMINNLFPPHGNQDSLACRDSMLPYSLRNDFFTSGSISRANIYWAWAYDSMLTVGFAACAANSTDIAPQKDIFASALEVDFEGLSGTVRFNNLTGSREVATANFQLVNYVKDANGNIQTPVLGFLNVETNQFDFQASQIVFRSGSGMSNLPQDITPPYHELNLLPLWAKAIGYAETAILLVASLMTFGWVRWHIGERMIINSQPVLLQLIVLGCIIASFSIFTLTIDDTPGENMDPNAACMSTPILFTLGMLIALTALAAKMYRVSLIFNDKRLRLMRVSVFSALRLVGAVILIELVIVIVWITVAPLQYVRAVSFYDLNGFPVSSSGLCTGNGTSIGLLIATFAILFIGVLWSALVANRIKHVPVEFQESRYVAFTMGSLLQLYCMAIPAAVASYSFVLGRFILLSSIAFVTVAVLLLFMFLPKILQFHFNIIMIEDSNSHKHQEPHLSTRTSKRNMAAVANSTPVVYSTNNSGQMATVSGVLD